MQILLALGVMLQAAAPAQEQEPPKAPKETKNDEPWSLSIHPQLRFTDVLTRDPLGHPLASEILDREDWAVELDATFSTRLLTVSPVVISFVDSYTQVSWFRNEEFDLSFNAAQFMLVGAVPPVVITHAAGLSYAGVGGDPYAQRGTLTTTAGFGLVGGLTHVLSYTYNADEYKVDDTDAEDRDGVNHTFYVAHVVSLEKQVSLTLGVLYTGTRTQGDDFDYRGMTYVASLEVDFLWQTKLTLRGTWSDLDYSHANSADTTGRERSDASALSSLKVRKPFEDWMAATLDFEYRNRGSNVPAFDYEQIVLRAGLELSF